MRNDQNLHDENMNMLSPGPGGEREFHEAEEAAGAALSEQDPETGRVNAGKSAGTVDTGRELSKAADTEKEQLKNTAETMGRLPGTAGKKAGTHSEIVTAAAGEFRENTADPERAYPENANDVGNEYSETPENAGSEHPETTINPEKAYSETTVNAVNEHLETTINAVEEYPEDAIDTEREHSENVTDADRPSTEAAGRERTRSRRFRGQEMGAPGALPDRGSEREQNSYAADQGPIPETRTGKREKRVYAGFFVRLCAYLLDRLILLIPLSILRLILWFAASGMGIDFLKREVFFRFTPTDMILYAAMAVYFIGVTYVTGRTIGKRIMRITVISNEDRKPRFLEILYRETVGRFLSSVIFCIGYLLIIVSDKKEALHDYLADTRVVYY